MAEPLISVVVAQRNSARTIVKCLDSLLSQDHPAFEVIVIDDASTDGTLALLDGYAGRVKIIRSASREGPSIARNKGAAAARGQTVAFTDGDCVADKSWLSQLARGLTAENIAGAGGMQETAEDEQPFGRLVSRFFYKLAFATEYCHNRSGGLREVNHNPSCNVIYRRDVFLSAGGFCPGLWPGEDVELDYRLRKQGYRLMFNPAAKVYHYRAGGFRSFCRMMLRYGWAQGVLARKYGLTRKIQLLPVLVILFLFFSAFAPAVAGIVALVFLFTAFISSGLDAGFTVIILPAVFFWNLGFIRGFSGWRKVFPV